MTGSAGYVLPRFNNKVYINIVQGDHFGHVDLGNDRDYFKAMKKNSKVKKRKRVPLHRKFTVQAQENCDLLTLTLEDLDKMNTEFPDICKKLMDEAIERVHKETTLKIDAIRECEMDQTKQKSDLRSKLSAIFLSGLHKTMIEVSKDQKDDASTGPNGAPGLQKKKTILDRAQYLQRNSKMKSGIHGLSSNGNYNKK